MKRLYTTAIAAAISVLYNHRGVLQEGQRELSSYQETWFGGEN